MAPSDDEGAGSKRRLCRPLAPLVLVKNRSNRIGATFPHVREYRPHNSLGPSTLNTNTKQFFPYAFCPLHGNSIPDNNGHSFDDIKISHRNFHYGPNGSATIPYKERSFAFQQSCQPGS